MDFTIIDLIAATTNALNGGLLARRPDHYRHYTVVGIVMLAVLAGIMGGVLRDVILDDVPVALENPLYLFFTVNAGLLAAYVGYRGSLRFREGLFQFMTAFSLPWYAAVGVDKALEAGLPPLAPVFIGVIGATAGRYVVDITSGVTPKHFVRGEWFVGTAILTSVVYSLCWHQGLSLWPATLISFAVGFSFRLVALFRRWEEPEPWEPPELKEGEPERLPLGEQLQKEFRGDAAPAEQQEPTTTPDSGPEQEPQQTQ